MKLKELIEQMLTSSDGAENTRKADEARAKDVIKHLGTKQVGKLTFKHIEDFKLELKNSKQAPSTINAKLALLSKSFTYAQNLGLITHRPKIQRVKNVAKKLKYLNKKEEYAIVGYFREKHPVLADITIIGIYTGLRISEILELTPENVDKDCLQIWNTKTNKPRTIPMNKQVKEVISRLEPDFFKDCNYRSLIHHWDKMKKELNLSDITLHTLRHTFCSRLSQEGVDSFVIMHLAGHESINTTMKYVHLNTKAYEKAISKL